jgi:prepilin-type N-terminal cleavage/methylation domain-containing protein
MTNSATPNGFSLTELSIVLVIIGVITGSAISALSQRSDAPKRTNTLTSIERIDQALTAFLVLRGRLPCPADQSLSLTHSDAGKEYCPATSTKDMSGSLPSGFVTTTGNNLALIGGVPTQTLGLPKHMMLDGWGNRLSYAVTGALSGSGGTHGAPATTYTIRSTTKGLIPIKNSSLVDYSHAAYSIISHGPNGFGAWNREGGTQRSAPSHASEQANSYAVGVIAGTFGYVHQMDMPSELIPYDDIVYFRPLIFLIANTGKRIANSKCTLADEIINTADVTLAGVPYHPWCGAIPGNGHCAHYFTLLATQIQDWCL